MKFYRKKSLGISLSVLCWTVAIFQLCSSLYLSVTIKDINQTTKELVFQSRIDSQSQALDTITALIKKYDKNTIIISDNNAGNYCDYYFYSPKLNKNYKIMPLSQGSNIHIAITDAPVHIYIGTPYIDYDF